MIRRPPRSTLFPTRRSSDLGHLKPNRGNCLLVSRSIGKLTTKRRTQAPSSQRIAVRASVAKYLQDRKSTRLNSSHLVISYAVFCLKKKKQHNTTTDPATKRL